MKIKLLSNRVKNNRKIKSMIALKNNFRKYLQIEVKITKKIKIIQIHYPKKK